MSEKETAAAHAEEPRGFGEHTRGLAGEYAHEQGWGLDEEERTRLPDPRQEGPQDTDGGTNYSYGARDFGDEPVNLDRVGVAGDGNEDAADSSNNAAATEVDKQLRES